MGKSEVLKSLFGFLSCPQCSLVLFAIFGLLYAQEPFSPHSTQVPMTEEQKGIIKLKIEKVFGDTLVQIPESEEEFITADEEYLDQVTTTQKTVVISLPGDATISPSVTTFPILIPSDLESVTESVDEDSLISSENSNNYTIYQSGETVEPGSSLRVRTKGRISTSGYFKRTCGDRLESCEKKESDGGRPTFLNFIKNPQYCRCDREKCGKFGDCCWTIAETLLYRNPYKCHQVQNELWALMISKCSEEYKSAPNADKDLILSCETPSTLMSSSRYTVFHDIPVFSETTQDMYKNIFCGKCNGLETKDFRKDQMLMKCSRKFNSTQKSEFLSKAVYKAGKRIWVLESDNSTACGLWSPNLEIRLLSLFNPGLRYCKGNVIDKCPAEFAKGNQTVAALCSSYTQYVESRPGYIFKNPHCAECYGLDAKWDLRCLKEGHGMRTTTIGAKITPGNSGASLESAGLSLLFDFDLGQEGSYVGYESQCPEDMMWDFLRKKCTLMMCPKDYELGPEGKCIPKDKEETSTPTIIETGIGNNQSSIGRRNVSCYVLIIHESEYILLPNRSILVFVNETGKEVMFHPTEYESWNESSMAVCARELSASFRQRFSPVLNYISLSALGFSVFFSVIHILLFLMLPKMRNLPGMNLFCLSVCLLVSQFLFLAFISSKTNAICITAAVLMHYFFLASFFWMNVLSFDVWRTFSTQFMARNSSSGHGKLFLKYSLYAWFVPLVTIAISFSFDFLLEDTENPIMKKLRPLYGHNNLCWIGQGLALFSFFALPTVILIILNIILFTLTARAILLNSRDSQKVFKGKHERCSRKNSNDAEVQRMKLYMKLGIIMGVTWILGFLSGISEWEWLWYPFVLVNGLQGTFIFFGFDAKPKVLAMLREKFSSSADGESGNKRSSNIEATNSTWRRETTTSTSTSSGGNANSVMVRGKRESTISHKIPV